MSLDIDLMVMQPVSVYSNNITHNLAKMAREVKLVNKVTLYDIMWRPDELEITHAHAIVDYLEEAWHILMSDPDYFKTFDPENGWGSYEGLCNFVYAYKNACWDNMDAELRISR